MHVCTCLGRNHKGILDDSIKVLKLTKLGQGTYLRLVASIGIADGRVAFGCEYGELIRRRHLVVGFSGRVEAVAAVDLRAKILGEDEGSKWVRYRGWLSLLRGLRMFVLPGSANLRGSNTFLSERDATVKSFIKSCRGVGKGLLLKSEPKQKTSEAQFVEQGVAPH
jgi:hypothetical protein